MMKMDSVTVNPDVTEQVTALVSKLESTSVVWTVFPYTL